METAQNEFIQALRERMFALKDERYAAFSAALIPTVPRESVIGVRLPQLRALAAELARSARQSGDEKPGTEAFLASLPHEYHEENLLHAFLIEREKDLDALIARLDAFLPFVDNWAVCDCMRPKLFARRFEDALPHFRRWLQSGHPYTVRYGVGMLMCHGLGERFRPEFHALVGSLRSGDYYVNMMRAWYFATALALNYEQTLPWLDGRLDTWTHNAAIRKAIESRRLSDDQKAYLRTMAIKQKPGKGSEKQPRRVLDVAAGVVFSGGKVLICRRPHGKARGGQWEFPGGKLEPGETAEQALVRELREELAFTVRPVRRLTTVTYEYPDVTVRLCAITAESSETPTALEHTEIRFSEPSELFSFDLCPADRLIAEELVKSI